MDSEVAVARLETIYRYPIKGCRGERVEAADVTTSGLVGDRQWVLVNAQGIVNQKVMPALRFLEVFESSQGLTLNFAGSSEIHFDESAIEPTGPIKSIGRDVPCVSAGSVVSEWLLQVFGQPLQLVKAAEATLLHLEGTPFQSLHGSTQPAFVDIAPILIVSLASLADLNDRIAESSQADAVDVSRSAAQGREAVQVEQFRPNLVISGLSPFAEESAATLQIGDLTFSRVVACERCSVTTFDPFGEQRSKEPLRTLSQYRKNGVGYAGGVTFGGYFVPDGVGSVSLGDEISAS